jgi:hypothetical protein
VDPRTTIERPKKEKPVLNTPVFPHPLLRVYRLARKETPMRDLVQNLALKQRVVNPETQSELRAAILKYALLTSGTVSVRSRAKYFRRLHLLAAGSPRGMNFARQWCCALHWLSEKPPTGTQHRQEVRLAWRQMVALTGDVVAQIQSQIGAGQ